MKALDNFYIALPEPQKSCMLALKEIILGLNKNITPEWKFKLPFFYYQNKMFCYLWIDKKTKQPYLGVVKGHCFEHPLLKQEKRKQIKVMYIRPDQDLPIEDIRLILKKAISYY